MNTGYLSGAFFYDLLQSAQTNSGGYNIRAHAWFLCILSISLFVVQLYRAVVFAVLLTAKLNKHMNKRGDNIWQYLTVSDNIWQYLTVSDNIWQYLTVSDNIWQYLTVSDNIWQYLTISDSIWQYLTVSDNIWQYLIISDSIWHSFLITQLDMYYSLEAKSWLFKGKFGFFKFSKFQFAGQNIQKGSSYFTVYDGPDC